METQGHFGTPDALQIEKNGTCKLTRVVTVFLSVLTLAALAVFFAGPRTAQAQQPRPISRQPMPDFPSQPGFPQEPQNSTPDLIPGDPTASLGGMNSPMALAPMMPVDNSRVLNNEACQTWTAAAVNSPTVSVARLAVPGKASHEFQKACSDFKGSKLRPAEDHARKAVKIYPDYAAAWVLLGQILEAKHDNPGAIEACRKGMNADPRYAPPYMCLAQFAARANDWDEAYALSDHALSLDPATDPYAYLYTAIADLHLKRLDQAELYGRSAEKLDKWNRIPRIHLLMAKVYEAKGDSDLEAQELRKFVKEAPHNSDWQTAKTKLAEIEDHPAENHAAGDPPAANNPAKQ